MRPFSYERARDVAGALATFTRVPGARFLAGGTDLLALMKDGVQDACHLIDINAVPEREISVTAGGVRLGALCRMADVANHADVRARYPVLAQALEAAASPQLRNAASLGGNLLQRTRCDYFRTTAFAACNKRDPGSGCAARSGEHRGHAIFGGSEHCFATHPSDLAVALVALDAQLDIAGPSGHRRIAVAELFLKPGVQPHRETSLGPGELLAAIRLPASRRAADSAYLKVRGRASLEFALVSVAAAVEVTCSGVVASARLVLGGVGTVPWRVPAAEKLLAGQTLDTGIVAAAADAAVSGAQPRRDNAFKVELARRAVIRVLSDLGGIT
jgi:xanthine dehydrogenase YagS FAD-binding subunit